MSEVKQQIIEQIGDDFGVTVRYEFGEYGNVCIDFFAAEVLGVGDDGSKWYSRQGAASSDDDTDNFEEAERFVSGSVKWDGCCHFYFGDDTGYLHSHSITDIDKLHTALRAIYERCGELMLANGGNLLEDEFACGPKRTATQ